MASDLEFDVVISGYGPTGQAAASLLSRLGHRVAVFEKHSALYGMPRLCTIDGESARIVQAAGDVDRAFRVSSWLRTYELVDADGEIIVSVDYSDKHMCGYPGRISFYQPDVEDVMDEAARGQGAEVNLGWEVVDVRNEAEHIEVRVRARKAADGTPAGTERIVRSRWLIGADGANSAVRELLGIEREDFGYRDAFLGVDAERIGEMPERLSRGVGIGICDPGRHLGFVPIGSNRYRFEFIVNPDDDHSHLLNDDVAYEMLEESWGLTRDQVRVYRQVIYPFAGKLAHPWRLGRALLAGDAAHLMPPFMGQGACSGLRDSINLAWKLHLVLTGVVDEALIDTYEIERKPHARVYIQGSIDIGLIACERDPILAEKRNEAYRNGTMPHPPQDQTLLNGILRRDADGSLTPYAGHLVEQGIVRFDGRVGRFDDVVGWGFHLLGYEFDPADELDAEQRDFLDRIGCRTVMITNDPDAPGALDMTRAYEAFFKDRGQIKAVLTRPDFYIYGAVWSPSDVSQLVDDLRADLADPIAGARAAELSEPVRTA
jgi:3-(3-hydroxy-phenyl)propionate hydroxylase